MATKSEFEPTEQDFKHIREWFIKMPHIVPDYDDKVFRAMFIASKGSLQRTKDAYEKLNSLGYTYPDMLGHLDPLNEITQYFLDNVYFFPMQKKTDEGSTILIATSRANEIDSTKFSVLEIGRYMLMSFLVLTWENNLGPANFILVYDYQNAKLSELKSVTPTFLKDFASFPLKLPVRFQRSHNVNVPRFFQPIITFLKSVLPKKLSERIHFHDSMDELHAIIPKDLLPKEFGGYADDLDTLHNLWKKKIESYRDRLISENKKMRALDHLRSKSNVMGELKGSFRKLEVD